jgi:hypothetical protein
MRIVSLFVIGSSNVIFILCLPILLVLAPGVHGQLLQGIKLLTVYISLILIPISIIGSWVLYRQEVYGKAICFSLLPVTSIFLFLLS